MEKLFALSVKECILLHENRAKLTALNRDWEEEGKLVLNSLKQSLGSNDISSLWQTNRFVKNDCAQGTVAAILEHGRASDSSTDRTIGVAEHTDMIRINMAM